MKSEFRACLHRPESGRAYGLSAGPPILVDSPPGFVNSPGHILYAGYATMPMVSVIRRVMAKLDGSALRPPFFEARAARNFFSCCCRTFFRKKDFPRTSFFREGGFGRTSFS